MLKFGKDQTTSMHNEAMFENQFLLSQNPNFIIKFLRSEKTKQIAFHLKTSLSLQIRCVPKYVDISNCFGRSSKESVVSVCVLPNHRFC